MTEASRVHYCDIVRKLVLLLAEGPGDYIERAWSVRNSAIVIAAALGVGIRDDLSLPLSPAVPRYTGEAPNGAEVRKRREALEETLRLLASLVRYCIELGADSLSQHPE